MKRTVWIVAALAVAGCGSDGAGGASAAIDAGLDGAGADGEPGFGDASTDAADTMTSDDAADAALDGAVPDGAEDSAAPADATPDTGSAPDADALGDDVPPPVLCTALAKRCSEDGAAVERCLSDGTGWAVDETCADACVDAACVEVVCAAGESFCDGDTLRTCNADGTASTATKDCPAGCLPTLGGADCQQCEAGTKGCTEAGHAWQCVHPTQPPAETACAPGLEACVAGGCAGLLAWTIGDTETDAMLWLAIHTAACALDGAAAGADHLCWAIDTTKLQAPITAAGFNGWLCGGVESGTVTVDDFLPVGEHTQEAIFQAAIAAAGCTGAPQLALPSDTLETGHPVGDLCESYVQASSTVVVGPCP